MATRGRGELYTNRQGSFNPLSLCSIAGHTYRIMTRGRRGEERRRDETGWQQEGEENFIPIDKDLLTHYLYVPLQDTHMGWRREGEEKKGDRMATRRRGELYTIRQGHF